MDVEQFLVKQGWKKGQGLRPGAIKTALLVKHRKDNKGLGFNPQATEGWWERVFDGHLKSLDVTGTGKVQFAFDEEQKRRETSPLYASFHKGGTLNGTDENIAKKQEKEKAKKVKPAKEGRVSKPKKEKKKEKKAMKSHDKKEK